MALSDSQYAFFVLLSASGGLLVFILQRFKSFSCGKCKVNLNSARNNQPLEIPAILQEPQQPHDDIEAQQPPPPPPPPPFPAQAVLQDIVIPLAGEIIRRLSHDKT